MTDEQLYNQYTIALLPAAFTVIYPNVLSKQVSVHDLRNAVKSVVCTTADALVKEHRDRFPADTLTTTTDRVTLRYDIMGDVGLREEVNRLREELQRVGMDYVGQKITPDLIDKMKNGLNCVFFAHVDGLPIFRNALEVAKAKEDEAAREKKQYDSARTELMIYHAKRNEHEPVTMRQMQGIWAMFSCYPPRWIFTVFQHEIITESEKGIVYVYLTNGIVSEKYRVTNGVENWDLNRDFFMEHLPFWEEIFHKTGVVYGLKSEERADQMEPDDPDADDYTQQELDRNHADSTANEAP